MKVPLLEKVECNVFTDEVNVDMESVSRSPHDVVSHLRNLPEGWKASQSKLDEAREMGIVLLPNQTLVDAYSTGERIA